MLVPKATVNENDSPTLRKNNVRRAWQIVTMQPEAITERVQ